jgi:hypothetical protein
MKKAHGVRQQRRTERQSPTQPYCSRERNIGQIPRRALYGEMLVVPTKVLASVVEHRHRLGRLPRLWHSPSNVHPHPCDA